MKHTVAVALVLVIILSVFSGCSSAEQGTIVEKEVNTAQTTEEQQILLPSWVPESISQDLDETILWDQMLQMLSTVISQCDDAQLDTWNGIMKPDAIAMERDDGMLAIYEAACILGFGHQSRGNWLDVNAYYSFHPELALNYDPYIQAFTNTLDTAPFEHLPGQPAGWTYVDAARVFSMGQSSPANEDPFFAYGDGTIAYNSPLTRREAIAATEKLIQAYEVLHSGGYSVVETDWADPLLAEADAAKNAVLNSSSSLTKSDELILGETYTGKAYYVSNSGNDKNDGLSPETAWATLEKVIKTNLKYGDAVFFERGGTWYGYIGEHYGVAYSAYGTGEKPVISGSPLDIAQAEKWVLHTETADGGKIWQIGRAHV